MNTIEILRLKNDDDKDITIEGTEKKGEDGKPIEGSGVKATTLTLLRMVLANPISPSSTPDKPEFKFATQEDQFIAADVYHIVKKALKEDEKGAVGEIELTDEQVELCDRYIKAFIPFQANLVLVPFMKQFKK